MMKESELMTFGKFKDEKLGDVPAWWLVWCWKQPKMKIQHPDLFAYIEKNSQHLTKEAKSQTFGRD